MKITKIKIKNLFGISEFEADQTSLELLGGNGTGKTSVLDAIRYALTNRSTRDCIVKNGATEGEIIIETDAGLSIVRKPRTNKTDYKSIKQDGKEVQSPEAFLSEIFSELQLNPVSFINMDSKEQNRIILDLIEYSWTLETIRGWFGEIPAGVDYEKHILEVLQQIASEDGQYFQQRQGINRDIRNKKAFIEDIMKDLPEQFNAAKWESYDLQEIHSRIEKARQHNAQIEKAVNLKANYDNKVRSFEADREVKIANLKQQLQDKKTALEVKQAELAAELKAVEEAHFNIGNEFDNGKKVINDGIGMSFDEVNELFLRIGRHRREHEESRMTAKGRTITGRKGLGKLALFGIGKNINITTKKEGVEDSLSFDLNWTDITSCNSSEYKPKFQILKDNVFSHGTRIILSELSRQSPFDINLTAEVISKLFNLIDNNFRIFISLNDGEPVEITSTLKYESIVPEFEWDIESLCNESTVDYEFKKQLKGKILSTPKPISSSLRGITLYVNGRLANEPGFFGISDSSYGYSYFTGWIEANFIDESSEDLISTDRQSLNWESEATVDLQNFLQSLVRAVENKWRCQRKTKKEKETEENTKIDINAWTDTMSPQLGQQIKETVDSITSDESISTETATNMVKNLHEIVPEYPQYHFRELHPEIQDAAKKYYEQKDYYIAFWQALLRYKNSVKTKACCSADEDRDIMTQSFGKDKVLSVTRSKQLKPNGDKFSEKTIENIEEGQKFLSMGIVAGGRNVLSHEEITDLKGSELFTEKDCLDLLSLLSHLFKRLDDA